MAQQKALFLLTPVNGEWSIGTRPIPTPAPGELLVKIQSTALNPVDWKIRVSDFGVEKYPAILGADSAGTIEAVGEGVQGFSKGDRVVHQGLFVDDKAGFQQYTIVPAEIAAKIPPNVSFDEAASIPVGLATAAVGLYGDRDEGIEKYKYSWEDDGKGLYRGRSIVIFGGSSSVGQYVIQLAKLSGFSPIITTASLHNKDHLLSLGATHVIDRNSTSVPDQIKEALNGAPVKFIFDAVSLKDTQTQAWDLLASGGQLALVLQPQIDKDKYEDKTIISIYANVHFTHCRQLGVSLYSKLTTLLEDGSIKPIHVEVLPNGLAGIPDGLERLKNGEVSGKKLVVRPQETV